MMLHKKIPVLLLLLTGTGLIMITGCYKNKTVLTDAPVVTKTVSFSQDLQVIFNKSCSVSGCHSAGGQTPNLTTGNAYNSLITGSYLDKSSPENSFLYLKMSG